MTLVNGNLGSFKLSLADGRVLFISTTGTALVANEGENGNTVDERRVWTYKSCGETCIELFLEDGRNLFMRGASFYG